MSVDSYADDGVHFLATLQERTNEQRRLYTIVCRQQFSKFEKIKRILKYCSRCRLRTVEKLTHRALLSREWSLARVFCFRVVQFQYFKDERARLIVGESISQRRPLARLSAFICQQRLIRVGGRLHYSPLPFNEKQPIVLPDGCTIIRRFIESAYQLTLHGGVQLMLSHLYRSFWITRCSAVVTGALRWCVRCTRFFERVVPSRGFAILFSRGRGAKTTKAT